MERPGRHIHQITSSPDIIEGEVHRIDNTSDESNSFTISMNDNIQIDDDKIFSEIMFSHMFLGLYVTFSSICSVFKAVWTFITFILIPVLRDNVLPIIVELFKGLRNMFRSANKKAGKEIEDTIDHYHNNTTNWL